jgi:cytidylate kinase
MIITIDGPAGSGKSTAARMLAKSLGIAFFDTGATYRAATLLAMRKCIDLADEHALAKVARDMNLRMFSHDDGVRVFLDGADVSRDIRTPEVSENSFYAARSPMVRGVLVELQRRIGRDLGDFVTEGRDQGTVVFPQADVKFFLDARPEIRARRRCDELLAAGEKADYDEVLAAIVERDRRDRSRSVGPLATPEGAIVVDTSDISIEQTRDELLRHVEARR